MKASVAFIVGVAASSSAWAQVPNPQGNNNPVNINNVTRSTSGSSSTSQGGQGGTARGGAASANPASTSGATANPASTASSGSSAVTISTGNTTYPANQTVMTVPMVYTPSLATGNVCALGASGGASWLGAGFAFGASWESMQCERRQTAALLWNMNTPESKAAAKEVLCNSPEIREAYARAGAPCTIDLMRVAGQVLPQQTPTIAPQPMTASFNPAAYQKTSDCLTAAQAAGASLSLCAGKR